MAVDISTVIAKLNEVVPSDWIVSALGDDGVKVRRRQGTPGSSVAGPVTGGDPVEAVRSLMSFVQDEIAVATGCPWPAQLGSLPMPQVTLDGQILKAWFGSPDRIVLDLGEFPNVSA